MFHVLYLFSTFISSFAVHNKCMYIDYRGKLATEGSSKCSEDKVCKRNFKVSLISIPPYTKSGLFESILRKCCGKCVNITFTHFANISELSPATFASSEFILPFVGKSSASSLYGKHFIPIVDVPAAFYFTANNHSILTHLIIGCLKLYPLIVVSLLLALISGFVAWSLETWNNQEEFPRSFARGLFDGFWWSFVSMTTVGYGDRTVKSIPGRLFSVLWILIGITLFGLLTALITSEIMKAVEPHAHISMIGSNVGVLKLREYDAALIVEHGGILQESSGWNFHSDVLLLIGMLRKKEIDGFLLDKYTLAYTSEYLQWKKGKLDPFLITHKHPLGEPYEERRDDIIFFTNCTYRTPARYTGEKLSYGVLVNDTELYNYFRDAARDNRRGLGTSVGSEMNKLFPRNEETGLFATSGSYFMNTVLVITGVLCAIFLFGIMFEGYRHRKILFGDTGRRQRRIEGIVQRTDVELLELSP